MPSATRSARSTRRARSAGSARFSRKKASMSNSAIRRIMNSFRPDQQMSKNITQLTYNQYVDLVNKFQKNGSWPHHIPPPLQAPPG